MSIKIFVPVSNERVHSHEPSPALLTRGTDLINQEVVDWLLETAQPYYMCRNQVFDNFSHKWLGTVFHFSKESTAAMFKLAWGGI